MLMENPPTALLVGTSLLAAMALWLSLPKKAPSKNTLSDCPVPPFVCYHLPVLGSVVQVVSLGLLKFIQQKRKKHNQSPIITSLVAGERMHFVADPACFSVGFRYPETTLSMGPVIEDFVHHFFGMTREALKTCMSLRAGLQPLMDHLLKSDGVASMVAQVQTSARTHVQRVWDDHATDECALTMDLMAFVNQVMFRTVLDVLISPDLSHQEFLDAYETFEKAMPVAFVGLPMRVFAPTSYRAREQLVKWLSDDDNVTWRPYLQSRRAFLREHGSLSRQDLAKDHLLWTWGAVSNFLPAMFWFLYYVATIPEALAAIRKEVDPVLNKKDSFSVKDLENMLTLESTLQEVLRLRNHFLISRQVLKDMEFDLKDKGGKYFLKEGEQLIMFTAVLHHDSSLHPNPTEYQWDRFLNNPKESVSDLRTFGGGPHYCPGRKFATHGAKAFVAHLLYRYDLEIQGTAEPDMTRDGLGILHSKNPVQVTLRPRKVSI